MISRSNTLRDQAYQLMRRMIISQDLPFGAKLSVADLSRQYGISNSPIREAISLLEMDGLVENVPNFGFHVIDFTEKTFNEVSQCIHVVLDGCYDECINTGLLPRLEKMLEERLEFQEKSYTGEASFAYACAAIEFDRAFVDVCSNEVLSKMFDGKFNLLIMDTLYAYDDTTNSVAENLQQHRDILAAIKKQDHKYAKRLLAKHFDKTIDFENVLCKHGGNPDSKK